jgi:hypothetical protein
VQAPDVAQAPVPLLNVAVQSLHEDPQQLFVSIAHVVPFAWYPLAHVKTQTSPLHDGVPFATAGQSAAPAHRTTFGHFCGQAPPQSTPVSSPLRTPSPQLAS